MQGQKELLGLDAPPVVWNDEQGGEIVEDGDVVKGLKVRYPGLKLEKRTSSLAEMEGENSENPGSGTNSTVKVPELTTWWTYYLMRSENRLILWSPSSDTWHQVATTIYGYNSAKPSKEAAAR